MRYKNEKRPRVRMVVPQFTGGFISTLNDVGSNPDIGNLKEHFL